MDELYRAPKADLLDPSKFESPSYNPWLSIWLQPRATMRFVLRTKSIYWAWFLLLITCIPSVLWGLERRDIPLNYAVVAIVGVVFFILYFLLFTSIMYATRGWVKGGGNWRGLFIAVGWSSVPFMWGILIDLPYWVLYSGTVTLDEALSESIFYGLDGLTSVISVWGTATLIFCVAEVHKISFWKSLLHTLLSTIFALIPVGGLAYWLFFQYFMFAA
ncbi:YIP1 family protein [Porticoccus sp. W117]|uniref:YIP1 family protein n=1 Tax=Porticoccus sp. W117 TaxID=3054777 RepID=UPI002598D2CD|nr:YIP1 family protein [Porticoccus sp. W117]MDM3870478.1 YIP1 family protein [Porticoccus sp. W117]